LAGVSKSVVSLLLVITLIEAPLAGELVSSASNHRRHYSSSLVRPIIASSVEAAVAKGIKANLPISVES
jgi:hypothetical protein